MSTVYRHPHSKFWFARFNDRHGNRVSRSTKSESKREAKVIAGKFEAAERDAALRADQPAVLRRAVELASLEAQSGKLTPSRAAELIQAMLEASNPATKAVSFRSYAAGWLDLQEKRISANSAADSRRTVKLALAVLGTKAELPLRQLTKADLDPVMAAFTAGTVGSSANKRLSIIRRIFTAALNDGHIDRNPAAAITAADTSDSTERLPFTAAEVRRLLEAAPSDEWEWLIRLAAQTGIRRGDLLALTTESIQGGNVILRPSKTSGTTGKIVSVPLSQACLEWIATRPPGRLFPTLAAFTPGTFCYRFGLIMTAAGVEKEVVIAPGDPPVTGTRTFHSLRHSFVSWLAQSGVAEDVRMRLAGHAAKDTHAGYTDHGHKLRQAIEALPKI